MPPLVCLEKVNILTAVRRTMRRWNHEKISAQLPRAHDVRPLASHHSGKSCLLPGVACMLHMAQSGWVKQAPSWPCPQMFTEIESQWIPANGCRHTHRHCEGSYWEVETVGSCSTSPRAAPAGPRPCRLCTLTETFRCVLPSAQATTRRPENTTDEKHQVVQPTELLLQAVAGSSQVSMSAKAGLNTVQHKQWALFMHDNTNTGNELTSLPFRSETETETETEQQKVKLLETKQGNKQWRLTALWWLRKYSRIEVDINDKLYKCECW